MQPPSPFVKSADGTWLPPVYPKQLGIMNPKGRYLLVSGPRKASKTIGCLHACMWRLWMMDRGQGMMLGKTTTNNLDAGAWNDLTTIVLPTWLEADFGMELITPPRMQGVSHKMFFEVSNMHGNKSTFFLDSLDIEDEVDKKFRNKRYELIYITELSNFKQRRTFDILEECLRRSPLGDQPKLLIGDTNPADEGEDSWIYQLWYIFAQMDLSKLNDEQKVRLNLHELTGAAYDDAIQALQEFQNKLEVQEFTIDDNLSLSPAEKREQRAKYSHNKGLLDRYYYGKWTRTSGEGVFSRVWQPVSFVLGNADTVDDPEPSILLPDPTCYELILGYDIGNKNTAVVLMEKVMIEFEPAMNGKPAIIKPCFKLLDEFCILDKFHKVSEVAAAVMDMMAYWELQVGRKVLWRHWSDRSSLDRVNNVTATTEHEEIFNATGGEIMLQGSYKASGSVEQRVSLLEKLLFENRLYVSARCVNVIEMFGSMKRKRNGKIDVAGRQKHIFDATGYGICMEAMEEIEVKTVGTIGLVRTRI